MKENTLGRIIAQHRRELGLTQQELADQMGVTDKAVSKWERGEGLPDVAVLKALSELYGVSLDYLVTEHEGEKPPRAKEGRRRLVWALCSCALVWVVATAVYVLLSICGVQGDIWLAFVFAAPATFILLTVFAALWSGRYSVFAAVSGLIWTSALAVFFSWNVQRIWLVFVAAAPLQLLAVFWFILRPKKSK